MAEQLIDRNTGQPMSLPGLAASIGFGQNQSQTTSPSSTKAGQTSEERAATSTASSNNQVNTTPGALQALEGLIAQLTTRPDINPAALEVQFPKSQRLFSPQYGWYFVNPKSGMSMSPVEAQAFDAKQEAAKEAAIKNAPIIQGGTATQKQQQTERKTEIDRNRQQQRSYSKDAAATDANALIQKAITDALEAALPQITAGLEGAGTSRSTIAAGLTQKAALKGATEGAALAANLGAQYGQINTQLSGVLEALTRSDPNSPEAMLLNAIVGSKGLVSVGSTVQQQATEGTKTGTTNTDTSGNTINTTVNRTPFVPQAGPVFGGSTNPNAGIPAIDYSNSNRVIVNPDGSFGSSPVGSVPAIMPAGSQSGLFGTSITDRNAGLFTGEREIYE